MAGSVEYVGVIDGTDVLEINNDGSVNVDLSNITRGREDSATFNSSLANGASTTLEVQTNLSDKVVITIDDGTTDGIPATYNMTQRIFKDDFNDYMYYDDVQKQQARSWLDPTFGSKFQVEITNNSNASATYRISVESYREMN